MEDVRPLPKDDDRILRQITSILPTDELDAKLLNRYWEFKRCCDRASINVLPQDLARLCTETGFGKKTVAEAAPPTVADLYRRGELKKGDVVEVQWRNSQKIAFFRGLNASNQPIVQLEGDSEERTVSVDKVSIPEPVAA